MFAFLKINQCAQSVQFHRLAVIMISLKKEQIGSIVELF